MSFEAAEAKILAEQIKKILLDKRIKQIHLKDYERLQRIGFINKDISKYDNLIDGVIHSVKYRGNSVLINLDNRWNLLIGPEYGGKIRFHKPGESVDKYHLRLDLTDDSVLSIRLTNMGVVQVAQDCELNSLYLHRRDFGTTPSLLDADFSHDYFSKAVSKQNRILKGVLVGKDAVIVGVSNSAYQDALYRAGLHPKRKGSSLSEDELKALYKALVEIMDERLEKGGKSKFTDIYGKKGNYEPLMGPNKKDQKCLKCGSIIEKISHGGGSVYLCPKCQK